MVYGLNFTQCVCAGYCESWILSLPSFIINSWYYLYIIINTYHIPQTLGYILDARQLGLKLIANVTFGYTAASYSGRMPCVEVS